MIKGYVVNQKRLDYLEKTIKLIDIANCMNDKLDSSDAREILRVIGDYSKALDLLDDYDHKSMKKFTGSVSDKKINYDDCINIISKLKFNEKSNLLHLKEIMDYLP